MPGYRDRHPGIDLKITGDFINEIICKNRVRHSHDTCLTDFIFISG